MKPHWECIQTTRKVKCRACGKEIDKGRTAIVLRNAHISPKAIDLFFHVDCIRQGLKTFDHRKS